MDYKEELKKYKIKQVINNTIAVIWLCIVIFGGLYLVLNVKPAEYFTDVDRIEQLRGKRK